MSSFFCYLAVECFASVETFWVPSRFFFCCEDTWPLTRLLLQNHFCENLTYLYRSCETSILPKQVNQKLLLFHCWTPCAHVGAHVALISNDLENKTLHWNDLKLQVFFYWFGIYLHACKVPWKTGTESWILRRQESIPPQDNKDRVIACRNV